jgi:hypothetical protein
VGESGSDTDGCNQIVGVEYCESAVMWEFSALKGSPVFIEKRAVRCAYILNTGVIYLMKVNYFTWKREMDIKEVMENSLLQYLLLFVHIIFRILLPGSLCGKKKKTLKKLMKPDR